MRILVVEDDNDLQASLAEILRGAGYAVDVSSDGIEGLFFGQEYPLDLAIIDLGLPGLPGLDLIRKLRAQERQFPILILTARADWQDKVEGLEAGADDYLTKPMSLRELNARVRALLRRPAQYDEQQDLLRAGPLQMNLRTHEVHVGATELGLTPTEFKLLKLFLQSPRKVFSREQILDSVWGINAFLGDRTVDVHILRLRKILKPHGIARMIITVRGSGYRLSDNAESEGITPA